MAEVKIKLFANLREAAGTPELLLSGEKVIDVLLSLTDKHPELKSLIFEKNDEKSDEKTSKSDGEKPNEEIKPITIDFDRLDKRKEKLSLFSTHLSDFLIDNKFKYLSFR